MDKLISKKLLWVILGGVLVLAGVWGSRRYQEYRINKEIDEEVKQAFEDGKAPFKADKGGGETPQEALKKFQEALLSGDIDGALGYVFLSDRGKFRKELEAKTAEELRKYAEGLPEAGKIERYDAECYVCDDAFCNIVEKATYYFYYYLGEGHTMNFLGEEIEVPAGKHGISIEFIKTFNNKWQLEQSLPASFED